VISFAALEECERIDGERRTRCATKEEAEEATGKEARFTTDRRPPPRWVLEYTDPPRGHEHSRPSVKEARNTLGFVSFAVGTFENAIAARDVEAYPRAIVSRAKSKSRYLAFPRRRSLVSRTRRRAASRPTLAHHFEKESFKSAPNRFIASTDASDGHFRIVRNRLNVDDDLSPSRVTGPPRRDPRSASRPRAAFGGAARPRAPDRVPARARCVSGARRSRARTMRSTRRARARARAQPLRAVGTICARRPRSCEAGTPCAPRARSFAGRMRSSLGIGRARE